MNSDEQHLINGLFSRLQEAARQSSPRDAGAEAQINEHLARQPAAAYYMTQAILIQEAAIKRLEQRVQELEAGPVASKGASAGGFLSGLFTAKPSQAATPPRQQAGGWMEPYPTQGSVAGSPQNAPAPAQGGGFLRGALQTATGVAGGIMVAELLGNMFHHSQPQEIVEVIHEQAPQPGGESDFGNSVDNASYDAGDDFSGDGFDSDSSFF
jgi:hypothetical protein